MHPIKLKEKWRLANTELALVLGYETDSSVVAWGRLEADRGKRNPPSLAFITCYLLDQLWQREGKSIKCYNMHPMEFKEKWRLTNTELAIVLGYESDSTVVAWGRPETGKGKRNPPNLAFIACYLLDQLWQREGKSIKCYMLVEAC